MQSDTFIKYRKVSFYSKNVVYIQSPEDWNVTFPISNEFS